MSKVFPRSYVATRYGWFSDNSILPRSHSAIGSPNGSSIARASWEDSVSGGYRGDWRAQLKAHGPAVTSLNGIRTTISHTPGSYSCAWENRNIFAGGAISSYGYEEGHGVLKSFGDVDILPPPSAVASVRNEALSKFYRRAESELRPFQGGVFLGELAEAVEMVRRPGRLFKDGLNGYLTRVRELGSRLSRLPKAKRQRAIRRMLADQWLEYSFGWRPLLSDIRQGAEALAQIGRVDRYIRIESSSSVESGSSVVSPEALVLGANYPKIVYTKKVSTRELYKFYGEVRISNERAFGGKLELFALDFPSFVPTVWELLPWSFLIDYFANVGDVLRQTTLSSGQIPWMASGTLRETLVTRTGIPGSSPVSTPSTTFQYCFANADKLEIRSRIIQRQPEYLPTVSFQVSLPGKPVQWVNMLALRAASTSKVSRYLSSL